MKVCVWTTQIYWKIQPRKPRICSQGCNSCFLQCVPICIFMYSSSFFLCWNCAFIIPSSVRACLCGTRVKPPPQRALLEQKQKKKRQEPLMVQSNVDGRSRTRRTKQSEEQAPLVESYLSSNSSTIYHGEQELLSSSGLRVTQKHQVKQIKTLCVKRQMRLDSSALPTHYTTWS